MVVGERVGQGGDAAAQAIEHHGAQALTSQPASAVSTALSANSSCFEWQPTRQDQGGVRQESESANARSWQAQLAATLQQNQTEAVPVHRVRHSRMSRRSCRTSWA